MPLLIWLMTKVGIWMPGSPSPGVRGSEVADIARFPSTFVTAWLVGAPALLTVVFNSSLNLFTLRLGELFGRLAGKSIDIIHGLGRLLRG